MCFAWRCQCHVDEQLAIRAMKQSSRNAAEVHDTAVNIKQSMEEEMRNGERDALMSEQNKRQILDLLQHKRGLLEETDLRAKLEQVRYPHSVQGLESALLQLRSCLDGFLRASCWKRFGSAHETMDPGSSLSRQVLQLFISSLLRLGCLAVGSSRDRIRWRCRRAQRPLHSTAGGLQEPSKRAGRLNCPHNQRLKYCSTYLEGLQAPLTFRSYCQGKLQLHVCLITA